MTAARGVQRGQSTVLRVMFLKMYNNDVIFTFRSNVCLQLPAKRSSSDPGFDTTSSYKAIYCTLLEV
jgi:hypothetical protein